MKYKESIIGMIPIEWEVEEVNSLIQRGVIQGVLDGNHGAIHPTSSDYVEKGIPFIMANNVNGGKVDIENCKFISEELSATLLKGFAKTGDVLLTHKGTVGETAIVPKVDPYIVLTPQVTYYRIFNDKILYNKYLKYYFDSLGYQDTLKKLSAQSTRAYIGITQQKKLDVVIPPLQEQKKIAKILSTVDEHIDEVDGMIQDLKELKKGLMQKLLTQGIGHTEFKDSPVGRIPIEWEVKKLRGFIDLLTGFPFKSNDFSDNQKNIQLLRGINIGEGGFKWNDDINKYWENDLSELRKYHLQVNDIVISMDGSKVGKNYAMIGLEKLPLLLVQRVARIRTNEFLDQKYLYYVIASKIFQNYVDKVKTSSGIPHISAKQIYEFKIPFPVNIQEQEKIAEILNSLDVRIVQYESKSFELKEVKKGLMQQLLTGKVRVKIDN